MKNLLSSYIRRKFKGGDEVEEVHEIARNYFGGDFPNRQRSDCPPQESFQKLIGEKGLPDEILRNHLLSCSECFNEFQATLRRAKLSETQSRVAFQFRYKPILISGFAAVVISLGGLFWIWNSASNSSPIARSENPEFAANTSIENAEATTKFENQPASVGENNLNLVRQNSQTNRLANENITLKREPEPGFLAKNEVEIDLNQPVWRDSLNGEDRKAVRLTAQETQLRIKLPKENPAGVYEVFIVDEFGKTISENKKIPVRNRMLSVKFNLKNINGKGKRLCFAPAGEIPDCILVNIGAVKKE